MASRLSEIFEDAKLIEKIQRRLPYLFQIAAIESSRAGKTGMEVGIPREKILIALLVYRFGEENVDTNIPATEPEIDAKLLGYPISVKTITGNGRVKIGWTVDAQKAREFRETYAPKCDVLLARIKWDSRGDLFFIPLGVQKKVFADVGRERYIKLPKPGTNPRGVEYSSEALRKLTNDPQTKSIQIQWQKSRIEYKPYQRWLDYWKKKKLHFDKRDMQTKIA